MSWEATAWAKNTRGHRSHATGRLLLILAECHNSERGVAWPSQKYLSENCEMPISTVQWCLRVLEDQGFITTLQKGNQYQPTEYRLNFEIVTSQSREPAKSSVTVDAQLSEPAIPDSVAAAQLQEAAKSERANIAGAGEPARKNRVNPQAP